MAFRRRSSGRLRVYPAASRRCVITSVVDVLARKESSKKPWSAQSHSHVAAGGPHCLFSQRRKDLVISAAFGYKRRRSSHTAQRDTAVASSCVCWAIRSRALQRRTAYSSARRGRAAESPYCGKAVIRPARGDRAARRGRRGHHTHRHSSHRGQHAHFRGARRLNPPRRCRSSSRPTSSTSCAC